MKRFDEKDESQRMMLQVLAAGAIGAPTRRLSFVGSFFPFALTAEDRRRRGDPRLSVGERAIQRVKLYRYR